jgi:hypothetical protein
MSQSLATQIQFVVKYRDETLTDPVSADPTENPDNWLDVSRLPFDALKDGAHTLQFICPVKPHTCFDGVDCLLLGVRTLLQQPLPDDDMCTDFDLYQYILYRRVTRFAEFGGLVRDLSPILILF